MAFTKHITNALMQVREEKPKHEASIHSKPIIKMKVNDFYCNALGDLGASISIMPKKLYDMLDLPPLEQCYLDVFLLDNAIKKPLGRVDDVHIMVNITLSLLILLFWTLSAMHLVLLFWEDLFLELLVMMMATISSK